MKIPKSISVLGHTIKIILKPRVYLMKAEKAGVASYNEGLIEIATRATSEDVKVSPDNLKEVFWHEVNHMIDDALNIGLTENQIILLTRGQIAVIKDNNLDLRK